MKWLTWAILPLKCFQGGLKNRAAIISKQRHECVFVCCSGDYLICYNFLKFQILVVFAAITEHCEEWVRALLWCHWRRLILRDQHEPLWIQSWNHARCQMPASVTAVALQPNPKKVSGWKKIPFWEDTRAECIKRRRIWLSFTLGWYARWMYQEQKDLTLVKHFPLSFSHKPPGKKRGQVITSGCHDSKISGRP